MTCGYGSGCPGSPNWVATTYQASWCRCGQEFAAAVITVRFGQVTAAQFLTLRLIPTGSTQVGCDDSDGPGHAPRYLDVSAMKYMIVSVGIIVTTYCLWLLYANRFYGDYHCMMVSSKKVSFPIDIAVAFSWAPHVHFGQQMDYFMEYKVQYTIDEKSRPLIGTMPLSGQMNAEIIDLTQPPSLTGISDNYVGVWITRDGKGKISYGDTDETVWALTNR